MEEGSEKCARARARAREREKDGLIDSRAGF